jgi:hypothetical protein
LIARIELKSQLPAAQAGRGSRDSSGSIGGKRPGGGINRRDDRVPEFRLRSADYFRQRAALAVTDESVEALIVEAEATLEAWARAPIPASQPPRPGDPQFKRWVAESPLESVELARLFNLSKRRINQIRAGYRAA